VAAHRRYIPLVTHTGRSEADDYRKSPDLETNLKHLAQPFPCFQKPKTKKDSWEKGVGETKCF